MKEVLARLFRWRHQFQWATPTGHSLLYRYLCNNRLIGRYLPAVVFIDRFERMAHQGIEYASQSPACKLAPTNAPTSQTTAEDIVFAKDSSN